MKQPNPYILMLEDDEDDRDITRSFFAENDHNIGLEFLTNSDDVLPFLRNCLTNGQPLPVLILLDKNAPAGGGMDVLRQIKSHPALKMIPVVMISGSAFEAEVNESYRLGANSYILKPASREMTERKISNFLSYWLNSVELPTASAFSSSVA